MFNISEKENLFEMIRKDKLTLNKRHFDIFIEACDFLNKLPDCTGENFTESGFEDNVLDLQGRLKQLTNLSVEVNPSTFPQKKHNPTPKKQDSRISEEIFSSEVISADGLITPEMVNQFVSESTEMLDSSELDLLALEEKPEDPELVQSAFRSLHSLKGNAGFINYKGINSLARKAETYLNTVRNKQVQADS
jgi:two-component system, chemotaxis family, sensor kinase CheA